jgi:hypothetical protein
MNFPLKISRGKKTQTNVNKFYHLLTFHLIFTTYRHQLGEQTFHFIFTKLTDTNFSHKDKCGKDWYANTKFTFTAPPMDTNFTFTELLTDTNFTVNACRILAFTMWKFLRIHAVSTHWGRFLDCQKRYARHFWSLGMGVKVEWVPSMNCMKFLVAERASGDLHIAENLDNEEISGPSQPM